MKRILVFCSCMLIAVNYSIAQTSRVDIMLDMAINAYKNGNTIQYIEWLERAQNAIDTDHDYFRCTKSLNEVIDYYKNHSEANKYSFLHETVLEVWLQVQNCTHMHYTNSLSKIAECYRYIGNYHRAIEINKIMLNKIMESNGENNLNFVIGLNNLVSCYNDCGDYARAINAGNHAIKIISVIGGEQSEVWAAILNNLATSYNHIGDYKQAYELYKQSLDIKKSNLGESHPDYALSLNNIASCYENLGRYDKALEMQNQSLNIISQSYGCYHPLYATYLNNLAIYHCALNDYLGAIELFQQVLAIRKICYHYFHPSNITTLCSLAACYLELNQLVDADVLLQKALDLSKQCYDEYNYEYTLVLNNIAEYNRYICNYSEAIEIHQESLNIRRQLYGDNHPEYALCLNNLASCYHNIKEYQHAIKLFNQTIDIRYNTLGENHPYYILSLNNLARSYYDSKSYKHIFDIWNQSYALTKQYILGQFKGLTKEFRLLFGRSQLLDIITNNNLYMPIFDSKAVCRRLSYNSMLFTKGALISTDIEFDKIISESGDTILLEKFEEFRTINAILNTYYNKPIAERPEGEVDRLKTLADKLERELVTGSKEYGDFTRSLELEWQDVRSMLKNNEVAIEIMSSNIGIENKTMPYIAALILRKGWNAPKFVELCKLDELEELYIKGYKAYNTENSAILYNLIWSKLEPYINEGDDVYFAPDGLLYQMNIEVLHDADGRRANEKWNLYRVSSTRELCMEKPTVDINSAVLYGGLKYTMDDDELLAASRTYSREDMQSATRGFVADSTMRKGWNYLPETKTEVESIAQMCESHNVRAEIFSETSGNEESFKALSGKKTPIIHLATHGFFYKNEEVTKVPFFNVFNFDQMPQKPDNSLKRSGLILAGGQKAWLGEAIPDSVEDGILLAEEIAMMDLTGTDLVVLSACETGLGEITSEGVFGLQRAFKKAGVQTIIMSLWSVNDLVASLFMRVFYQEWLSGKTKHEAFAIAQNTVRESYEGNDWAAFIMLD